MYNIFLRYLPVCLLLLGIPCLAVANATLMDRIDVFHKNTQKGVKSKAYLDSIRKEPNLIKYVNPLMGTDNKYSYSHGNLYPAVALPRGMNMWTPQTEKDGNRWKYKYKSKTIRGFDETHQINPWGSDYGCFSLMPVTGNLVVRGDKRAASFSHNRETAKPNFYKVAFNNGITAELAPTERSAYFRFLFPRSKKAYVIFDTYTLGHVKIIPQKREIVGYININNRTPHFKNYFVLKFKQPFISYGTWRYNGIIDKNRTVIRGRVGAYIQFEKGADVQVKVASSYISIKQARRTLKTELGQFTSIDQVKKAAARIWNKTLDRILVSGGSKAQKATFYSCLYRANLFPHKFYELDKNGDPYYYSPNNGKIYHGYLYTDTNFWDTFRTQAPLFNILYPTMQARFTKSLLTLYNRNGWLPEAMNPGISSGGMIGNHVISVLADAWAKGIHSFNPDSALSAYFHDVTHYDHGLGRLGWKDYYTLGYLPYPQHGTKTLKSTSRTLAYTYDDFCAYRLAKMTHDKFYERIFGRQMYNYRNVFSKSTNFMRGRDTSGRWQKPFNPYAWGGAFVEGNAWQWTWSVFGDVQGLINLMGGDKPFVVKLDSVFTAPDSVNMGTYDQMYHEQYEQKIAHMGQYNQGNQPSFHIPYLYDYAGQPWETQKRVRTAMRKLFSAGPDGLPGDEDSGSMASWYVLSALGLYCVTPGTNQYVIGSPVFRKAVITMKNGKKFTIKADNNSKTNVYIQRAVLNGKPYSNNWIIFENIVGGGVLHFVMGPQPNKKRGTQKKDAPFSLSKND